MHEIDVALSDYAISFFTTIFAVPLLRSPVGNAGARQWLVVFFLSVWPPGLSSAEPLMASFRTMSPWGAIYCGLQQ